MNVWMRSACWVCGAILSTGIGLGVLGCAGTYKVRVQLTPLGAYMDMTFTPLKEGGHYDFDGVPFVIIIHDGKPYRFYPSKGIVIDPDSGEMHQLDDPSWKQLLESLQQRNNQIIRTSNIVKKEEVQRQCFGLFTPNLRACMGFANEYVSMELSIGGDTPIPLQDEERWPTLERSMFVFPDGVVGSPDPLRLELSGEPSDVFGYLVALGVTDGAVTVNGNQWTMAFHENQWADLFMNGTLVTSISLH